MPRHRPLPPRLHGTAFAVGDRALHGQTSGRLRGVDLDAPFWGVRSVDVDLGDVFGRCAAFSPRRRPGWVFSHLTAAELLGAPLPNSCTHDADLHIGALHGVQPARCRGVVGHRLAETTRTTQIRGFTLTAPADTFALLATMLELPDLVAVGDFLVSGSRSRGGSRVDVRTTIDELTAAVAAYGSRRSARVLRDALPLVRVGVDSRPETHLRLALIDAGLPEPSVNPAVPVDGGTAVLHPDLAEVRLRIAYEYEGDLHRTDQRRFRNDIVRRERFEAAGWRVVRVTAHDLFVDRASFIARVRRLRRLVESAHSAR
ncbi:hypothetical protein BWO91_18940 [Plantibacter flavus]|uniref:hypothetical protein n=1 Tax=Plantibacter flavus TaxID=150123 RepID=UPI00099BD45D|nr:hypothetical protein [Plantibacter flavus]AQX81751.1 hypothetical protein BWO91_18940 [Plantibacter flavus]